MEAEELFSQWEDGRPKLWVTHVALALRRRAPDLFRSGDYLPMRAAGVRASHSFAFARHLPGEAAVITLAPRLWGGLIGSTDALVPPAETWGDTALEIPAELAGRYRNLVSGEELTLAAGHGPVGALLSRWPVALLERIG